MSDPNYLAYLQTLGIDQEEEQAARQKDDEKKGALTGLFEAAIPVGLSLAEIGRFAAEGTRYKGLADKFAKGVSSLAERATADTGDSPFGAISSFVRNNGGASGAARKLADNVRQRALERAQQLRDEAEARLAEARDQAEGMVNDARAQAEEQLGNARAQAEEQLGSMRDQAQNALDDARAQASEALDQGRQALNDARTQAEDAVDGARAQAEGALDEVRQRANEAADQGRQLAADAQDAAQDAAQGIRQQAEEVASGAQDRFISEREAFGFEDDDDSPLSLQAPRMIQQSGGIRPKLLPSFEEETANPNPFTSEVDSTFYRGLNMQEMADMGHDELDLAPLNEVGTQAQELAESATTQIATTAASLQETAGSAISSATEALQGAASSASEALSGAAATAGELAGEAIGEAAGAALGPVGLAVGLVGGLVTLGEEIKNLTDPDTGYSPPIPTWEASPVIA